MRILEKVLKRTGEKCERVLDIPCGYGRFSSLLLEKSFSLTNCDLSFSMVKRAREKSLLPNHELVEGVVADAKAGLPFRSGAFPLVFSLRFFHHIHREEERAQILEEFSRVSSRWLICSYYQSNFLHLLQRKLRRKIKKSPTRIKMISQKTFCREAVQAGFQVVKVYPLFRGIHSQHVALLRKAKT